MLPQAVLDEIQQRVLESFPGAEVEVHQMSKDPRSAKAGGIVKVTVRAGATVDSHETASREWARGFEKALVSTVAHLRAKQGRSRPP